MVFIRYFCKRFFINFFSITIVLTLVYNGIEFFEKLMRTSSHAKLSHIIFFTGLNIIPTYASFIPIGCWLATCALIRELSIRDEWNSLALLTITTRTLIKIMVIIAGCLMIASFCFYEFIAIPLTESTARYKTRSFKKVSPYLINKKWILPNKRILCYINDFDLKTKAGNNALVIYLTKGYKIAQTITACSYTIDMNSNQLIITDGSMMDHQQRQETLIRDKTITLPGLSLQLIPDYEQTPSLIKTAQHLSLATALDSPQASEDLLNIIIERLFLYFKIIAYPLVTLALFLLFAHTTCVKWFVISLPYPLMMTTSMLLHCAPSPLFSQTIFAAVILVLFTILSILMLKTKKYV